jgi:hypothetical protein
VKMTRAVRWLIIGIVAGALSSCSDSEEWHVYSQGPHPKCGLISANPGRKENSGADQVLLVVLSKGDAPITGAILRGNLETFGEHTVQNENNEQDVRVNVVYRAPNYAAILAEVERRGCF